MRILVVDDNRDNADLLAAALWSLGHGALAVGTAGHALMVAEPAPDALILDQVLPDMTGLELLAALRKLPDWDKVPVVMLTGYAGVEVPAGPEGPSGGPFRLLLKPATIGQIMAAVNSLSGGQ